MKYGNDPCPSEEPVMANQKETRVRQAERKARAWLPGWSVVRRIARVIIGVILIILGLIALFTPLTPGSWLALVGLEILGLRVLLRNRLRAWAAARPQSRFRRTTCRVLHLDGLDAVKRRWQRRKEKGQGNPPPGSGNSEFDTRIPKQVQDPKH